MFRAYTVVKKTFEKACDIRSFLCPVDQLQGTKDSTHNTTINTAK